MQINSVLVIDDEPDMQLALTHSLKKKGCRVQCARNGAEGLKKFKNQPFELVITDMRMPEMSGMQVLKGIRKLSPQVPVIMMTAYGSVNNAVTAMQAGATHYLQKPFSLETLSAAMEKVSDHNAGAGPSASHPNHSLDSLREKRIITQDPVMRDILAMATRVAKSDATILILGENGTGKELLASFIHQKSRRNSGPLVAINCAALQETLAESELFGHERGAFTGAFTRKEGRFELANQGTLLLDEVSELSRSLQAKILRALQEREIDRVGGQQPRPIDVRIIAVSNRDLSKAVREGRFREDLFYRLNVLPITLPPLRNRKMDIPVLAEFFLKKYSLINNCRMTRLASETRERMLSHPWPGNIRELENVVERAVLVGKGNMMLPEHLNFVDTAHSVAPPIKPQPAGSTIKEMEMELILDTLRACKDNRTRAAEYLGISIRTLRNRLRDYGITKDQDPIDAHP
jgi:two-component system response regulator AtoC